MRVKPRARAERVGGSWGAGELVVAVTAPATEGKANAAVVAALANAFGVRPVRVTIVGGHHHRTKLVEIAASTDELQDRLDELRAG